MTDPYKTLRIGKDVSMEEIKEAYRNMIKLYHPDRYVNTPEMKKIAEEKTREIIEAYHYLTEHFEDNPFRTGTYTPENESTASTSYDQTYNHSYGQSHNESQNYTYRSTNEEAKSRNYRESAQTHENTRPFNGQAIAAFVFGMISIFLMLLSPVFFSMPLTTEAARSFLMGIICYVILPILVIIFFIGIKRKENYAGTLIAMFFSSFLLLLLAPVLKLILVSAILLTAPIFSIIYGMKGWSEGRWLGKGMDLSTIGFFSGVAAFVLFVMHFALGVTL